MYKFLRWVLVGLGVMFQGDVEASFGQRAYRSVAGKARDAQCFARFGEAMSFCRKSHENFTKYKDAGCLNLDVRSACLQGFCMACATSSSCASSAEMTRDCDKYCRAAGLPQEIRQKIKNNCHLSDDFLAVDPVSVSRDLDASEGRLGQMGANSEERRTMSTLSKIAGRLRSLKALDGQIQDFEKKMNGGRTFVKETFQKANSWLQTDRGEIERLREELKGYKNVSVPDPRSRFRKVSVEAYMNMLDWGAPALIVEPDQFPQACWGGLVRKRALFSNVTSAQTVGYGTQSTQSEEDFDEVDSN